jgi:hypothetical protein
MPRAEEEASTPPVLDACLSGCAGTAIIVSVSAMHPSLPHERAKRLNGADKAQTSRSRGERRQPHSPPSTTGRPACDCSQLRYQRAERVQATMAAGVHADHGDAPDRPVLHSPANGR